MPRISLWNPKQGDDYTYIDRISQQHFDIGATGVWVHKYIGPDLEGQEENNSSSSDGESNELTIGDVLFLENRNRRYDTDIYELRGAYNPSDTDLDLTQFGIFLSDDTVRMTFHLNDMVDRLGRKLMSGDVLELPHLREYFGLDEDKAATNRFYVVEDASYPSEGFGPRWWNHMWRVRAKMMTDSPEFEQILNRVVNEDGTTSPGPGDDCCDDTLRDILSQNPADQDITDNVISQAEREVEYDPLWYRNQHFYVYIDDDGVAGLVEWKGGTDMAPNGIPLKGVGDSFPDDLAIGDFFLRTDFMPPVLYQRQTDCRFVRIHMDERKLPWTAANRVYDRFLENDDTVTSDDGTVIQSRQALSKTLKPRTKKNSSTVASAPKPVTAEPVPGGILLEWTSNGIGDNFTVWKAENESDLFVNPENLDTVSINVREFTDTAVVPGVTYYYRISVTAESQILYSPIASAEAL